LKVEVSLFGFGDERPAVFGASNSLVLTLPDNACVRDVFPRSGFNDTHGLSAILNGTVVPEAKWQSTVLSSGDHLKLLMAIEGG